MARKEWELLFNLSAKQNSNFSSTFKAAQSALVETQNRIQQLNKVQSDITAYQKQQQAVDSTKQRLAVLQQQYDNIQREIQETEGYSSALENKLISKQAQIDKTTTSLHTYEQRLAATGTTLREAGVDTTQLTAETTRLETEVDKLKDQQIDLKKTMDEDAEGATDFGKKSVEAIDAVESVLATAGIAKALGEIKDVYMDCISTAGDFEASMSNVEALSEASGNELEALSDKAKEMGATTKFTAGESADALSYMALAGWNTQSMLEGISPVLNLAAAANMDLAQASDIVTDYLTAFGLKASDTTHFVDVMAYAMAHSNTDVIQLGEAYKACASTATSLGYNEAYDAALKSVSGQYDLWDTAEKIVATSASSINSALESQITYWDSYNQNLESLNARAADIDGLSAVIASFADGSKDSVNAIAGMASASDADLAKMVQNYQELQEAQKTTSESMADLETGMSNAMDEIAQNVADSVADMNLSDEAKESAQATIQGFVDGAEGMLPRVQSVFFKIASAASTALAGAGGSYSSNIPGYAVGTESAAPGFAIVGEKGPELVYFNGGETVLTAPETRAAFDEAQKFTQIVSKNALDFAAIQQAAGLSEDSMQTLCHDWTVYNEYEALTANTAAPAEVVPASSFTPSDFTPSEGSPISINFAPVYNFSGVSDTQQFESLLTSHDNDMREYILDVVEEAEHDKFRRAYA